jgi:hypothetical protein
MKRLGKITVCLAAGLALNAGLRADDAASPDNPYATIATRNIFALIPPAPPPDPAVDAEKNLPKITPTGIMTLFGQTQVLFSVAPRPGTLGKQEFYTLSEGQRQDDVEVVKIDEAKSIVTFDNHGFTQALPLSGTASSSGGGQGFSSSSFGNPDTAPGRSGGGVNNGGIINFSGGPGVNGGNGNPDANNGNSGNDANNGMNSGASTAGRTYQPPAPDMTPEQTAILIETERAALMNSPHPAYSPALLPPTPLTKLNTQDGGDNQAQ